MVTAYKNLLICIIRPVCTHLAVISIFRKTPTRTLAKSRRLGKNIWLLSDLNVTRTEIRHWNQETPTHSFT
jgi:hypothetical protein